MAYKIFIDANIFIDFFDVSRKGYAEARQLFEAIEEGNAKAFISESVINISEYILTKRININVFKQMIIDLMKIITILPCSNAIVLQAYRNAKNDLEDAVLYQIALENKMDFFITNNLKDFKKIQHPSLQIVSAKQLLELL